MKQAQDALKSIAKAIELDPNYPEPYAWMGPLYKAVLAKLEPEKEARYNAEGDRYLERFAGAPEAGRRAQEARGRAEEVAPTPTPIPTRPIALRPPGGAQFSFKSHVHPPPRRQSDLAVARRHGRRSSP
ncbi:MAG: hypothetical protein MZV63_64730 [Marinilabiliales bacterium]|nr:hypothetical protein [Marinilabiliales bacterium]